MSKRFLIGLIASFFCFAQVPSAQAELVGLWRFDADVNPQPDSTGNGHDAELQNDVLWVDDTGRGGTMEFDGEQDYLEVEDTDLLSIEGAITISAWANFYSFESWNSIVSKTGDANQNQPAPYDVYTHRLDDGRMNIFTGDGDGTIVASAAEEAAELEEWVHVAVTVNEDLEVVHYLNGEENGEGLLEGAENIDLDSNLFIGSRADFVTNMNGRLDDVAIFDEALEQDAIMAIMSGDFGAYGVGGGDPGDFDGNGALDAADLDALAVATTSNAFESKFDVNSDQMLNADDRKEWVEGLKNTWFGDANLDGEFNSTDFVDVFQVGEYEDDIAGNSTWAQGDWNGDGDFDSSDFVIAFQGGGFEMGQRPEVAAVPEPSSVILLVTGLCGLLFRRSRK